MSFFLNQTLHVNKKTGSNVTEVACLKEHVPSFGTWTQDLAITCSTRE